MKKIHRIVTGTLLGLTLILNAQPGTLDNSFNPQTQVGTFVKTCAVQADGKILIGGIFPQGIARLDQNGNVDNSFITGTGTNNEVLAIAVQNDGKIIIAGSFTAYNGTAANGIVRLNPNGSVDNSFVTGAGFTGSVGASCSFTAPIGIHCMALQSDGKIVAGGCFTGYNGAPVKNLARLDATGALDNAFLTGTGPDGAVTSVALQNDGKILIGGRFYSYNSGGRPFLARVQANGNLDTVFSNTIILGPVNVAEVYAIALQNDGKIVIGGRLNYCNGVTPTKRICRLNTDATLDNTFLLNQIIPSLYYEVRAAAIQSDGKIAVGALATVGTNDTLNRLVRLTTNGVPDNTFMTGAGVIGGDVHTVVIQNDGKIIIGGDFTAYDGTIRNGLARLDGDNTTGFSTMSDQEERSFRIFPNPSRGNFNLQLPEELKPATITICDVFGKTVYSSTIDASHSARVIDISGQVGGVYYITVEKNGRQYRDKLILDRWWY